MMSTALRLFLFLSLLGAAACMPKPGAYDYSLERFEDNSYVIGVGDILRVSIYQQEDLLTQTTVRPDGNVALPLLGDIPAAGFTVGDFSEEVRRRYLAYLDEPRVTVSMVERRSYRVFVLGEVGRPGEISSHEPINVLQALSLAGGFSRFADRNRITILRREGKTERQIPFHYQKVVQGKAPEQNFLLRSGDTIIVP